MAALEAAVDLLDLIGIREVEARVQALAGRAKQALAALANVELKTNLEPELSGGVVKFRLKDVPTARAYDLLWKRHRLAIAMTPGGDSEGLRFSPHIYNTLRGDRPRRGRRARADRVSAVHRHRWSTCTATVRSSAGAVSRRDGGEDDGGDSQDRRGTLRRARIDARQLAEQAGVDEQRVLAIVLGRWTPSPQERRPYCRGLRLTRDQIVWGIRPPSSTFTARGRDKRGVEVSIMGSKRALTR